MSPGLPDEKRVCPEEKTAQSSIPGHGPVADCEHLARVVLDPRDLKNGKLVRGFLPLEQLEAGWSFIRKDKADENGIMAHGEKLAERNPDRQRPGYAVINVAEFRAIQDEEGRQAFCILDDEGEDAPAHAIAKKSACQEKSELRELRKHVMNLLSQQLTFP